MGWRWLSFLSFGLGQKVERGAFDRILKQGMAFERDVSAWAGENIFVRADHLKERKRWKQTTAVPRKRRTDFSGGTVMKCEECELLVGEYMRLANDERIAEAALSRPKALPSVSEYLAARAAAIAARGDLEAARLKLKQHRRVHDQASWTLGQDPLLAAVLCPVLRVPVLDTDHLLIDRLRVFQRWSVLQWIYRMTMSFSNRGAERSKKSGDFVESADLLWAQAGYRCEGHKSASILEHFLKRNAVFYIHYCVN
jgi:hypothetical protein